MQAKLEEWGFWGSQDWKIFYQNFFRVKQITTFFFFFDGKYLTSFRMLKNKYIMCTRMCHLTGIVLQPNNHVLNILGKLS